MLATVVYPFQLAMRHPRWTLLLTALGGLVLLGLDLMATEVGIDRSLSYGGPGYWQSMGGWLGYIVLMTSVCGALVAPPMVAALMDQRRRDRALQWQDSFLTAALTVLMGAVVTMPLLLIGIVSMATFRGLFDWALDNDMLWLVGFEGTTAVIVVGVVLASYLCVRFWFAGPLTLRDGRLRLISSWRCTNGKFWKVLFCALAIALLTTAFTWAIETGADLAFPASGGSIWIDRLALVPSAAALALCNLYFGAAQGFAFARLTPDTAGT